MSGGLGKWCKIRHIVRLRQMLRQWRNKARMSAHSHAHAHAHHRTGTPSDVPSGHVAVCVGTNYTRFVVRATYLNHPVFNNLLLQAEEEYGFSNHGPLAIPCDEVLFEEALRFISRSESGSSNRNMDLWLESRPLLHAFPGKTIW